MTPRVSIVMAVYNGQPYLTEAIESILNQTCFDFEFIIVDDASTDDTPAILNQYLHQDKRIYLSPNTTNLGLTASLNKGLTLAKAEYIARMDSDDIACPKRLEKQVAFMENHPWVGILGSACWQIFPDGRKNLYQLPLTDLHIRWTSLLSNPFIHPTIILRRQILTYHKLYYNESFQTAQDYELWVRLLRYTQAANLEEPLLQYRLSGGLTSTRRAEQLKNHDVIAWQSIQTQLVNLKLTFNQVSLLRALWVGGQDYTPVSKQQYLTLAYLYLDLQQAFMKRYADQSNLKQLMFAEALKSTRAIYPDLSFWQRICLGCRLMTIFPSLFLKYMLARLKRQLTGL